MRIVPPNGHTTLHLSEVTKSQLARAVNEQAQQIKTLGEQAQNMARVLMTIVLEPEAFTYQDGHPSISVEAMKKVRNGMELQFHVTSERVILSILQPEETSPIITPKIVGLS